MERLEASVRSANFVWSDLGREGLVADRGKQARGRGREGKGKEHMRDGQEIHVPLKHGPRWSHVGSI